MDMVMDDYNLIISTAVDIKDPNAPHNSRTKLMVLGNNHSILSSVVTITVITNLRLK